MKRIDAYSRLVTRAVVSGDRSFMDEVEALLAQAPPVPPGAAGELGGSALLLAEHVEKNGYTVPAWNSPQMERLVFRLVKVLESFDEVVALERPARTATAPWETGARLLAVLAGVWEMVAWDEATPDSVASFLMGEGKTLPCLQAEISKTNSRRNGVMEQANG